MENDDHIAFLPVRNLEPGSAASAPSLLIVTALGEELTPLLDRFRAQPVPPTSDGEAERYFWAEVPVTGSRTLRVVLTSVYDKGVGRMTAHLSVALPRWRPRHVILAGIAAAVPDGSIDLGTVLAATTIVDATENKVRPASRSTRHRSYECDGDLLKPLRCFAGDGSGARARFGIILCQPDVVKYAEYREELVEPVARFFDERPIGLEMEGAGLAIAVRQRPSSDRPSFGLVKGSVDYASFRKNDAHRQRAAAEVAGMLFDFIAGGWLASDPQLPPSPEIPPGVPLAASPAGETLHGRRADISDLLNELKNPSGSRIISIEGLGGIGKTALATRVVEDPSLANLFLRKGRFTVASSGELPFRAAELVSSLAVQFGFHEVNELSGTGAMASLLARLRGDANLVLVDNLELPEDIAELGRLLVGVDAGAATRWIVTARPALSPTVSAVRTLLLEELDRDDAVALLRMSLKDQEFGAGAVADRDLDGVYNIVGGNPQALKLSAGLLKRYPTNVVIRLLTRGEDEADKFYRFIYGTSWSLLSDHARATLIALRFLPEEGGDWERARALSGLETERLVPVMRELLDLNLVSASRRDGDALYSLHRLTSTFVSDVMQGWTEAERSDVLRSIRRRNIEHSLERMKVHEHDE